MSGRRHHDRPFVVTRAWFDRSLAIVRLNDDSVVPSAHDVSVVLDQVAADPSVHAVRTSALFADAASVFSDAGFEVLDTLALLRAELDRLPPLRPNGADASHRSGPASGFVTTTIRLREYDAAAAIDQAAFGREWAHDASELRAIRRATPACRVRVRAESSVRWRRRLAAVVVSGATATRGYLQRLSVDPSQQQRGHGAALTLDALDWMRGLGLRDCLVNTSTSNDPALALYASTGFVRLKQELRVLGLATR